MTGIVLHAHRSIGKSRRVCNICSTQCHQVHVPLSARSAGHSRPASPAPGELSRNHSNSTLSGTTTPITGTKSDGNLYLECLNCGRPFASVRYAPHLSSCLGIGSSRRHNSRANTSKPKSISELRRSTTPSDRGSIYTPEDVNSFRSRDEKFPSREDIEVEESIGSSMGIPEPPDSRKRKHDGARSNPSPYNAKVPSKLRETAFNSSPDGLQGWSRESSPLSQLQSLLSTGSSATGQLDLASRRTRQSEEDSAILPDSEKPIPLSVATLRQRANNSSVDYVLDGDEVSADSSSSDES